MRKPLHMILLCATCAATLAFLGACATKTPVATEGLSVIELFQRGQEAADKGSYELGISYYSLVEKSYPDDTDHGIWASYEIAFLYHKLGKNETSLSLINDLLAVYAGGDESLPPAPRVLAQKLKVRLEESLAKAPGAAEAAKE
jgi:outer membrane protein assembly factor BamD (BamD/ComL family)